ncbi:MAG: isoprenylcysteine carboxylmethyltransferase family protein [Candidatus Lokiarchaeota archaeon]|nr:isoprenylcysteine carboxylmethyltransferase family protein [Candidatus Lokiarchaeota archaeon]
MVSAQKIGISLLLPISVAIIIPLILLFIIDSRTLDDLFSPNLIIVILGLLLLIIGIIGFVKCNLIFIKKGKGTLMPLKRLETQKLIIKGPYKYVRHPMIISVLIILLGEALIFGSFWILLWNIGFFIGNIVYLPLFEDKGMEKRFGEDFLKYKKKVRAWIPQLRPYEQDQQKR